MDPMLNLFLALLVFFVLTFIVTWAIREGGRFDFLHPNRWWKRPARTGPRPEDRRP